MNSSPATLRTIRPRSISDINIIFVSKKNIQIITIGSSGVGPCDSGPVDPLISISKIYKHF